MRGMLRTISFMTFLGWAAAATAAACTSTSTGPAGELPGDRGGGTVDTDASSSGDAAPSRDATSDATDASGDAKVDGD